MRDWLSHRARIEPDGEALVHAPSGDVYTFGNLDTLVDDIAGRLTSLGVERGDHLATVLTPRLEYVCLVHAAMRLGVTLVPMGDGLTGRELAGQIDTADVTTVVCGAETEGSVVDAVSRVAVDPEEEDAAGREADADGEDESDVDGEDGNEDDVETQVGSDGDADGEGGSAADADREAGSEGGADGQTKNGENDGSDAAAAGTGAVSVVTVDDPQGDGTDPLSAATPEQVTVADPPLENPQLIVFTSGTTGDPKAVRLTTENLLASAVTSAFRLGLDPSDRWLATLPLHHMGGITPILRMPLYGTTVVLREGFEAGPAADDIDRYDVTAVSLVPTMLRRMLDRRGTLADSLRIVLLGGAPASPDLIERCRDYGVPVHPTYGMTETASQIATASPKEAFEKPETVGRPLLLTEVTVVDSGGAPLPAGQAGELVVDGPTVTPGYYGDEAATAETFGDFGLHTGDAGVVDDDGTLRVLNRLSDRIITGGENVDPGEVADVLTAHPAVRDAVVVGVPDAEWGERVSALVVAEERVSQDENAEEVERPPIDRGELTEFARDRLAGFKLPKTIAFAEDLPRTVSGTVDRDAVRERLSGGTGPEPNAPDQSDGE